jgi:hypothetical protein
MVMNLRVPSNVGTQLHNYQLLKKDRLHGVTCFDYDGRKLAMCSICPIQWIVVELCRCITISGVPEKEGAGNTAVGSLQNGG